jgi:hypothetical protein
MAGRLVIYCEQCGGTELSGAPDFVEFHCLAFCSPDCCDDYRLADDTRRDAMRAVSELATVAEVMRRDKAAAAKPATHKRRAA